MAEIQPSPITEQINLGPTYVGPAAVDSVTGVLSKSIRQSSEQSPEFLQDGTMIFREVFKGPTSELKDVPKTLSVGVKRSTIITAAKYDQRINPPEPFQGTSWKLRSCMVDEEEAGDHSTITFIWGSNKDDLDAGDDNKVVQWNLAYGQETVNVLAYCTNADLPTQAPAGGFVEGESYACRIQAWWNQPQDTAYYQPAYKFVSALGAGNVQELGKAEKAIARKLQQGRNPMRHYPILTKTTTYLDVKKEGVALSSIDYIESGNSWDNGCPIETSGWDWLKVGMTYNYNSKANSTTITETWWGAQDWDEDFYSANQNRRWQFGGVNDAAISANS